MRVRPPFNNRFRPWMLEGIKVCTSRSRPFAVSGDWFNVWGQRFLVKYIDHVPLGIIAERFYREEGFLSFEDFCRFWEDIHPIKGYQPDWKVYLHWFELWSPTLAETINARNWCPFCEGEQLPGTYQISCRHFNGYAGHAQPLAINVFIQTPIATRVYSDDTYYEGESHEPNSNADRLPVQSAR